MLNWLKRRTVGTQPEARWIVAIDGDTIRATDPANAIMQISIPELTAVAVWTTDTGPFATDVWWLLFGPDRQVALRFPLGATGMDVALDRLGQLPGFDHGAVALAMGSTSDAVFTAWHRGDDQRDGQLNPESDGSPRATDGPIP